MVLLDESLKTLDEDKAFHRLAAAEQGTCFIRNGLNRIENRVNGLRFSEPLCGNTGNQSLGVSGDKSIGQE